MWVEALTGGLEAHGRAEPQEGWGATVFLQVLDPQAFGGLAGFRRETTAVADACHASPPRPGFDRVRLPGERGLLRRAEQLDKGVALHSNILPALQPWVEKLGVAAPLAIRG